MKVLLINGSPHQKGCTFTALSEISNTFQQEGIASDIYWIRSINISFTSRCP